MEIMVIAINGNIRDDATIIRKFSSSNVSYDNENNDDINNDYG